MFRFSFILEGYNPGGPYAPTPRRDRINVLSNEVVVHTGRDERVPVENWVKMGPLVEFSGGTVPWRQWCLVVGTRSRKPPESETYERHEGKSKPVNPTSTGRTLRRNGHEQSVYVPCLFPSNRSQGPFVTKRLTLRVRFSTNVGPRPRVRICGSGPPP